MKKYIKPILVLLLVLLLSWVVLHEVYSVISTSNTDVISKSEEYRAEIETTPKRWLNGYLGLFFRFKSLGNINWLVLLLVPFYLWRQRGRELPRVVRAIGLAWMLGTLFIAFTGYSNSRYQLTLFPITAFLVIYLLWSILEKQSPAIKILAFCLLCALCIYNIVYYFPQYRFYWDQKIARTSSTFPAQMVAYINEHKNIGRKSEKIYVFNQPFYYYHTQRAGVDYLSPFYTEIFVELTRKEADRQAMYQMIRKKKWIKYILVGGSILSQYRDRMITEFINCECRPLLSEFEYRLYELREKSLEDTLRMKQYRPLSGVSALLVETHGLRGTFDIQRDTSKGRLELANLTPSKKGERLIQFGFDSLNPVSGVPVLPGQYVHFIVEGQLSKGLANRTNYIFIRDFQEKWQSTSTYFVSHLQRTYLLSRQIRPGSTRVMMGIRFTPRTPEDRMVITRIRAYISDSPL